ncbi:MAG TPA: PP2C family serine/threonine-protein phosphatase [Armatimonadota bacterium]
MSDQEITQEFEAGDLAEAPPAPPTPTVLAAVTFGAKTDLGRARENNEDRFDFQEPERPGVLASRGCLYAVADGMGGHEAGQIASEVALKTFFRAYYADASSSVDGALRAAVRSAHSLVTDTARLVPGRQGMGTTLTAAAVIGDRLWVAQVGDSRAYLLRDGQLRQVTKDHSWVQEQVDRGAMSLQDALLSPYRNVILRCLGASDNPEPDIYQEPLQVGDHFLLCSDGLTGVVEDHMLAKVMAEEAPTVAACRLIDLANERGGPDNITVVILRIDALQPLDGQAIPNSSGAASDPSNPPRTKLPWWRRLG